MSHSFAVSYCASILFAKFGEDPFPQKIEEILDYASTLFAKSVEDLFADKKSRKSHPLRTIGVSFAVSYYASILFAKLGEDPFPEKYKESEATDFKQKFVKPKGHNWQTNQGKLQTLNGTSNWKIDLTTDLK